MKTNDRIRMGMILALLAPAVVLFQNCGSSVRLANLEVAAPASEFKIHFCSASGSVMLGQFFLGHHAYPRDGRWMMDSDGDGLPDDEESQNQMSKHDWDTTGTGHTDLAVVRFGGTPNLCPLDPQVDTDLDGLSDCDESLISTDPQHPDSDRDGAPDRWELVYGFDPRDPTDMVLDPDMDGISNLAETLQGSDPRAIDSVQPLIERNLSEETGGCYNLSVTGYKFNSSRKKNDFSFSVLHERTNEVELMAIRKSLRSATELNLPQHYSFQLMPGPSNTGGL